MKNGYNKMLVTVAKMAICFLSLSLFISSLVYAGGITKTPSVPTGQPMPTTEKPPLWCVRGDNVPCSDKELSDPIHYRQILVLPTGYTAGLSETFRNDVATLIDQMSFRGGTTYTATKKDHLLYYGAWLPGEDLASGKALFGAAIVPNPFRKLALTLKSSEVFSMVEKLKTSDRRISPTGVLVMFNTTQEGITDNASPPGYLEKSYGIAKITRGDLQLGYYSSYYSIHELAHAALNFVDEYVERGFEKINISALDLITPLAMFDGSFNSFVQSLTNFLGIYNVKLSEILASNGNDNVDVTKYTSRVPTGGYTPNNYENQGGMFFGLGTWHDAGENIMADFVYAHSPSQQSVINEVFTNPSVAARPNDRIRNAGPINLSPGTNGVFALIFDADKNHMLHPTKAYDVQVTWEERNWKTCKAWRIPYPCLVSERKTVQKRALPSKSYLNIKLSKLYGFAGTMQKFLCSTGLSNINTSNGSVDLCGITLSEATDSLLPSAKFRMPYQEVIIPTGQSFTTYQWRFRTDNGTFTSGWTGWGSFFRAL